MGAASMETNQNQLIAEKQAFIQRKKIENPINLKGINPDKILEEMKNETFTEKMPITPHTKIQRKYVDRFASKMDAKIKATSPDAIRRNFDFPPSPSQRPQIQNMQSTQPIKLRSFTLKKNEHKRHSIGTPSELPQNADLPQFATLNINKFKTENKNKTEIKEEEHNPFKVRVSSPGSVMEEINIKNISFHEERMEHLQTMQSDLMPTDDEPIPDDTECDQFDLEQIQIDKQRLIAMRNKKERKDELRPREKHLNWSRTKKIRKIKKRYRKRKML